jgi:myo-inositol-1(or 4)-monophosphatase
MPDAGPLEREALLALAVEVAREAGALLVAGRAGQVTASATKSSPTDIVTAMDQAAEQLIRERLRAARPGDGVLGEEGGGQAGTSGVRWVVDPLDGTVNYLYRLPNWAVSIAAEHGGQVVAGVVHAPALGATYTAVRGGGAARDGRALSGSGVTDLGQALVATGFGYEARRRAAQARVLARVLPRVRDIRRFGAASLDLSAAAEGLVDAFYERGLQPWDLAAGGLVATEAGLCVCGLAGRPAGGDLAVAAPPALFGPLTDLLAAEPPADRD